MTVNVLQLYLWRDHAFLRDVIEFILRRILNDLVDQAIGLKAMQQGFQAVAARLAKVGEALPDHTNKLAIVAYVPEAKQHQLASDAWLKAVLDTQGGEMLSASPGLSSGIVSAGECMNLLKVQELMILAAQDFLRKRDLYPEKDDDSDSDTLDLLAGMCEAPS